MIANDWAVGPEKPEEKEEKKSCHRVERTYGVFCRAVHLPSSVDPNKITATAKDGVVTITVPKKPEAEVKKIKVDVK